MKLSVIVPLFREAARIPSTMPRLADTLARLGVTHEVILVVEPGGDDTAQIARGLARPGWRVVETTEHRGKGHAVRTGMVQARGEIAGFIDADLSTDPEALGRALDCFQNRPGLALVIGDRRHPRSRMLNPQGKLRAALGVVFSLLVRLLFPGIGIRDTQCGFKAFRHPAARALFSRQRIDGFAFDVELLLLARADGLGIEALPVNWSDGPRSSVRILRHGSAMLRDLARLRFSPGT